MNHTITISLLALTFALAGCADEGAEASVSYSGDESGDHSDTADCDSDGTLTGTGSVADGQVTVRLTDGDGGTLFQETFDGEIDISEQLTGDSGQWRLSAARGGDDVLGDQFSGDYDITIVC